MGECAGEDAVEEAVPHHGVVPQPDPDCPVEPRGETTETQVSKRRNGRGVELGGEGHGERTEREHGGVDEREQQHIRRLPLALRGPPHRRRIADTRARCGWG